MSADPSEMTLVELLERQAGFLTRVNEAPRASALVTLVDGDESRTAAALNSFAKRLRERMDLERRRAANYDAAGLTRSYEMQAAIVRTLEAVNASVLETTGSSLDEEEKE